MSAKILHGRRRGQDRASPELPIPTIPEATKPVNATELRQVTVLTQEDWARIQNQLNRKQTEQERIDRIRAEKESQRNKSKEMVKTWGNTIAGQRLIKLEAHAKREANEEAERTAVDLEEARYQAEQRKEAIEKAKTQQYYQTDRVKSFHSALLLTEVLKEREAQLELKSLIEKANEGKDNQWFNLQRREYEEAIKKDHLRAAARIRNATLNEDFLKSQVHEHLREKRRTEEENIAEANELKRMADLYETEKKQLEEMRRDEKKQQIRDNIIQMKEIEKLREIQAQQDEEENEECRIFAAAKRKMMKMRAVREKEIYAEKQKTLDTIKEKLIAQMKGKLDDEDERIKRALEEKEEKQQKEEEEKAMKASMRIKAQAEHRMQQLQEHEQRRKLERHEELELKQLRIASDEVFRQNEEEKERRKREAAAQLKKYRFHQKDERAKMDLHDKDYELAMDKANKELIATEEDQFQEYAKKVIKHCEEGGRNVYPLKKAAKEGAGGGAGPIFPGKGGIRPSYMVSDKTGVQLPCYRGDSTEQTKQLINGKWPTKKRIGFVW